MQITLAEPVEIWHGDGMRCRLQHKKTHMYYSGTVMGRTVWVDDPMDAPSFSQERARTIRVELDHIKQPCRICREVT